MPLNLKMMTSLRVKTSKNDWGPKKSSKHVFKRHPKKVLLWDSRSTYSLATMLWQRMKFGFFHFHTIREMKSFHAWSSCKFVHMPPDRVYNHNCSWPLSLGRGHHFDTFYKNITLSKFNKSNVFQGILIYRLLNAQASSGLCLGKMLVLKINPTEKAPFW